jgi:hypothetical protein
VPIAASHLDVTTLAVGSGISAVVAGFVSWLFNFALGGSMEVRKRRAVRRDDVHTDLEKSVRLQLNAITAISQQGAGWEAAGGKVTKFTDGFDALFAEMEESYQSIRAHLAGRMDINPERTIGWAVQDVGFLTRRVKNFRDGSIGQPPDGLTKERGAMIADLAAAQRLLEMARDCLRVTGVPRWFRRKRLWRHLASLDADQKAGTIPKTPGNYMASLPLDPRFARADPV